MPEPTSVGPDGFIAALALRGITSTIVEGVVRYTVIAVAGTHAGQEIPTGVNVDELQGWPVAPPHWVHLPEQITFTRTNIDRSTCAPGTVRHSRQVLDWNTPTDPMQTWLAHMQWVLKEAS